MGKVAPGSRLPPPEERKRLHASLCRLLEVKVPQGETMAETQSQESEEYPRADVPLASGSAAAGSQEEVTDELGYMAVECEAGAASQNTSVPCGQPTPQGMGTEEGVSSQEQASDLMLNLDFLPLAFRKKAAGPGAVAPSPSFPPGTPVMALFANEWHPARVMQQKGIHVDVQWDEEYSMTTLLSGAVRLRHDKETPVVANGLSYTGRPDIQRDRSRSPYMASSFRDSQPQGSKEPHVLEREAWLERSGGMPTSSRMQTACGDAHSMPDEVGGSGRALFAGMPPSYVDTSAYEGMTQSHSAKAVSFHVVHQNERMNETPSLGPQAAAPCSCSYGQGHNSQTSESSGQKLSYHSENYVNQCLTAVGNWQSNNGSRRFLRLVRPDLPSHTIEDVAFVLGLAGLYRDGLPKQDLKSNGHPTGIGIHIFGAHISVYKRTGKINIDGNSMNGKMAILQAIEQFSIPRSQPENNQLPSAGAIQDRIANYHGQGASLTNRGVPHGAATQHANYGNLPSAASIENRVAAYAGRW